jgi:adenylosuccinate lyase
VDADQTPDRRDVWDNPLATRYASSEMTAIWSDRHRYRLWREVWLALAEAEAELGLPITPSQLSAMRAAIEPVDFAKAAAYERQMRHDVFAHLHTYGDACPEARPILHLGATSAFVTDNADLMLIRESLRVLQGRLATGIERLAQRALETRDLVCLGFTHLQPAQPTTIGKRICLWIHDLLLDLGEIGHRLDCLRARGAKGTTGTQASFLELFAGDHAKVRELDRLVSHKLGFAASYDVTGQTYTRKVDSQIVQTLAGLAESTHKTGNDLRLAAAAGELEEPFERDQVGSSAMPYKRNPMRSERMCGLARFVMGLSVTAGQTAAVQWFERTLDDSAPRRLVLPQAFLASTTAGGDRQVLHEALRQHSHAATHAIREGQSNDLADRLRADPLFAEIDLEAAMEPRGLAGRAAEQVMEFIEGPVREALAACPRRLEDAELRV